MCGLRWLYNVTYFSNSLLASLTLSSACRRHLFVCDTLPESLREYIIPPTAYAIHADLNAVVFQQPSELQTGELAPLVSIEDVRCDVPGDRLLDRLAEKVRGQCIGLPP